APFACSTAALAAGAAIFAATAGADRAAMPVATGCPAGYSLFVVGTAHMGCRVSSTTLSTAVTATAWSARTRSRTRYAMLSARTAAAAACWMESLGLPLYNFTEDNNPAEGATGAVLDLGS